MSRCFSSSKIYHNRRLSPCKQYTRCISKIALRKIKVISIMVLKQGLQIAMDAKSIMMEKLDCLIMHQRSAGVRICLDLILVRLLFLPFICFQFQWLILEPRAEIKRSQILFDVLMGPITVLIIDGTIHATINMNSNQCFIKGILGSLKVQFRFSFSLNRELCS